MFSSRRALWAILAATIVAGTVTAFLVWLMMGWDGPLGPILPTLGVAFGGGAGTALVASLLLLLVRFVYDRLGLSRLRWYAFGGGLLGFLVVGLALYLTPGVIDTGQEMTMVVMVGLNGFLAGLIYWLVMRPDRVPHLPLT